MFVTVRHCPSQFVTVFYCSLLLRTETLNTISLFCFYIFSRDEQTESKTAVTQQRSQIDTASDVDANREKIRAKCLERLVNTLFQPENVDACYEIQETIGEGGFGVVNKVSDLATGKMYAMKKLPFDVQGNNNASLKREIDNIIKMRSHDNIVQWHDIFRTKDDQLAIVMDLCDMDLATFLKPKENRTFDILFDVALQITKGVEFLHTHVPPVIHRDIKPQNILIKIDPDAAKGVVVKIADFGISSCGEFSQTIDSTTKDAFTKKGSAYFVKTTHRGGGTRPFLAPEFFAAVADQRLTGGRFRVDASVDIFALGLVFAFMFFFNTSDYGERFSYACTRILVLIIFSTCYSYAYDQVSSYRSHHVLYKRSGLVLIWPSTC